jgi:hypothetical protein
MKKYLIIFAILLGFGLQSCVVHTNHPRRHRTTKVVYVKAPKHHKVVYVKGVKYHYWNGKHHKKTSKGYVVVRVR